MKGQKPEKYRDQWKGELTHTGVMAVSRGPDLSRLSDAELAQLKVLADRATEGMAALSNPDEEEEQNGTDSTEVE
jgi:hypothetical protein